MIEINSGVTLLTSPRLLVCRGHSVIFGVEDTRTMRSELSERARLALTHETAVAGENRR
jgi:hypothetical protein